jgi:hypothetical protein
LIQFGDEGLSFFLLEVARALGTVHTDTPYLPQVFKRCIIIEGMMLQGKLLIVGLTRLESLGNSDDAVDGVPSNLKLASLEILIALVGASLIVLKATFVLLLGVVVCKVNTG